ncbi:major tail protein [Streptomyces phage Kromp]|uniref:Major tail protein n=1 Tax=Streptomyces phage Kromp TaxID=2315619 RepID=A0A386K8Q7_9CAUD|nr:major tail protein [Streptomyces phage Kromp]
MANDADNVRAALDGSIYLAPKGTTAPADLTTPWGAAWVDLGFMSDDGVSMEYSTDVEDINAWQSLSPVRRILTSVNMTLGFTAIELKASTITAYFPDSTITEVSEGTVYRLDIPAAPGPAEWAIGLEWRDGDITNRLVIPRGEITDRGAISLGRSAAVGLEMTVSAYASSAPEIATWLSNDPAWALAA